MPSGRWGNQVTPCQKNNIYHEHSRWTLGVSSFGLYLSAFPVCPPPPPSSLSLPLSLSLSLSLSFFLTLNPSFHHSLHPSPLPLPLFHISLFHISHFIFLPPFQSIFLYSSHFPLLIIHYLENQKYCVNTTNCYLLHI